MWCVNGETTNHRQCNAHGELIPEINRECYALFVVNDELKHPKSPTATTNPDTVSQTLNTHAILRIKLHRQWPKNVPTLTARHN